MNIFIVCLNAVLPVFLVMMLGFLARKMNYITPVEVKRINALAFRFFMPLMLFYSIYSSDLSTAVQPKLLAYGVGATLVNIALLTVFAELFIEDRGKRGVIIQGLYRSNFVIIGLPIATALLEGEDTSSVVLMIAIVAPIYNMFAVILLETYRGGKVNPRKLIVNIIKNPLVLSSVIGLIFLFFSIELPVPIERTVKQRSGVASPLMLFLLGAFFQFDSIKHNFKYVALITIGRLVVVPAIFLSIAYFMGFRGMSFAGLLGMFASSTAVASFTMSQEMSSEGELAANIVISTSLFCSLTLYLWSVLFKALGAF